MKRETSRLIWGVLLILIGIVFLFSNFNIFNFRIVLNWIAPLLLAGIFALGGLIFLFVFIRDFSNWWALIPGFSLLGLGGLIGISEILPRAGNLGAGVLLGSIALGFLAIYAVTGTKQWWAIIPGGVLASLATLLVLEPVLGGNTFAGLFLMGIGLTFGILFILPTPQGRARWAIYPSGILLLVGFFILVAATNLLGILWPLALLGAGLFLIVRALIGR